MLLGKYFFVITKGVAMNFTELLEKYQAVVAENNSLKEELKKLKEQLSNSDCQDTPKICSYRSKNSLVRQY